MATHKSSEKRNRQSEKRRAARRYQGKTARTLLKKIRGVKEKETASKLLPMTMSTIDKLVKKNIIHRNKAANLKSKLAKQINKM